MVPYRIPGSIEKEPIKKKPVEIDGVTIFILVTILLTTIWYWIDIMYLIDNKRFFAAAINELCFGYTLFTTFKFIRSLRSINHE